MSKCNFNKAWVGPCGNELGANEFCEEHHEVKCASCKGKATRECSETMGLVCGAPLCNDCEHTIRDNGCNSGAPLPEGLRGHCKKTEQVHKPWYEKN
jgi:hypothetical protein